MQNASFSFLLQQFSRGNKPHAIYTSFTHSCTRSLSRLCTDGKTMQGGFPSAMLTFLPDTARIFLDLMCESLLLSSKLTTGWVKCPAGGWGVHGDGSVTELGYFNHSALVVMKPQFKKRFLPPVFQSQLKRQVGALFALLPATNLLCQVGLQMPTCIFLMRQFLPQESKQRCLGTVKELLSSVPEAHMTQESSSSADQRMLK